MYGISKNRNIFCTWLSGERPVRIFSSIEETIIFLKYHDYTLTELAKEGYEIHEKR